MKQIHHNSRRSFLKIVSFAAVTIGTIPFLPFKKSKDYSRPEIKTLSKDEANRIIREGPMPGSRKMKPAPAPDPGVIKED